MTQAIPPPIYPTSREPASTDASTTRSSGAALSAADQANLERRARRWWVSGIVSLLGLQVFIGIGSVILAVSDPTVAIVPNYHQKALDWDTAQRAAVLTGKLGWHVTPLVGLVTEGNNQRLVRVSIQDQQGRPVSDLNVSAAVYHHARGSEIHNLKLVETDAGYYEGTTKLTQPGVWQVFIQIEGMHGIASDNREMMVE